jgi:hypothetical protein
MLSWIMETVLQSLEVLQGKSVERPEFRIISMWDLTALVGRDDCGQTCMGVGVGSIRLLDVLSACLCSALFETSDEAQIEAQQRIGAITYDWSRRRIQRLRLWSVDPTLGLVRPYGFVKIELGSIVPKDRKDEQQFYFLAMVTWIMAHEIAHIAAGDLDEQCLTEVMTETGTRVRLDTQRRRPDREREADLLALRVLFRLYPEFHSQALSAVSFLLGVMQAVDDLGLEATLSGAAHPSPADRLDYLIESLSVRVTNGDGDDIHRLRALAVDLGTFAPRIARWVLEAPGDFRTAPFIIEDYQDDASEEAMAGAAANQNNAGDAHVAAGELAAALELYTEAESTLRGATYGEGQRIVYANLISTTFAMRRPAEANEWVARAVEVAAANNDKPAALYLMAAYDNASKEFVDARRDASARLRQLLDTKVPEVAERLRLLSDE